MKNPLSFTVFILLCLYTLVGMAQEELQNPINTEFYYWDGTAWITGMRLVNSYYVDEVGQCHLHQRTSYNYSPQNGFYAIYRDTYAYNDGWQPINILSEDSAITAANWAVYHRDTLIYNESQQLIQRIHQEPDALGNYFDTYHQVYEYTVETLLAAIYADQWISGNFVPYGLSTYTYNAEYQPDSTINYTYNAETEVYEPYYLTHMTYNDDGKVMTSTFEVWSATDNNWTVNDINTYSYNSDGQVIEIFTEDFISFVPFRTTYTIDNGLIVEKITEYHDTETLAWIPQQRVVYTDFCISAVLSVFEDTKPDIQIFPNPSESLQIKMPAGTTYDISIFNQQGQLVFSSLINSSNLTSIENTSTLPGQIYSVVLRNDEKSYVYKWVKK